MYGSAIGRDVSDPTALNNTTCPARMLGIRVSATVRHGIRLTFAA